MQSLEAFGVTERLCRFTHKFLTSNKLIGYYHGAIQSAKTDTTIIAFMLWAYINPDNYFAVGQTMGTLGRNILYGPRKLLEYVGVDAVHRDSMNNLYIQIGQSKVYCFGANDSKSMAKIRGGSFPGGGIFDEITLLNRDLVRHLIGRGARSKKAKIFMASNPEDPFHWCHQDFLEGNPDVMDEVFTLHDNPMNDQAYIDFLMRQYHGVWRDRLIYGKWVAAEGLVYASYRPADHEYTGEAPGCDYHIIGVDYGTVHPMVYIDIKKHQGAYYADREYFYDPDPKKGNFQKSDQQYADDFDEFVSPLPPQFRIFPDNNARSFKIALRQRKYKVRDVPDKMFRDPTARVRLMDSLIAQGLHYISKERCPMLCKNMMTYTWDQNKQKLGVTVPSKENDDAVNARDYGVTSDYTAPKIAQLR